ncbi:transcriptional regulator CysB-like protein [Yersinia aldovae ATCC 35236]|nr:transcriptional regulator CysB-like protein [Yersinia aldovae ATCC 35236]
MGFSYLIEMYTLISIFCLIYSQRLNIIRASARCNDNLTEATNTLFILQAGVSRYIRE